MIIDAHTHVWPDKIAEKALTANPVPGLEARGDGTVHGLDTSMEHTGVHLSCCLAIANEGRHVHKVNEFVSGLASESRYPVGTVHVDLSVEENLESLRRNNIKSVKLHPLFQRYGLDDKRLWDILDAFGEDISVITHVGAGGDEYTNSLSSPAMIGAIAKQFPKLRLMACHFGGYKLFDDAEEMLAGADIVLETSWPPSLALLRPERVRALIKKHGAERVVFGSDWPMTDPLEEIQAIEMLGLSDDEVKQVLGGTLARVLGLPEAA
ncbi:amidohydrolase family protein [Gulosibacter chungangensis]|uniref:Amidohydrolase family protein n=1 Tax=Gulosibacter chungangensis TaxID=979746 RepID=A0A7J5BGS7_9MICO|nr:amidohydrolase family protein [Gulosibacter chungangensis]KAB1645122.1 amidohydrolase family protein [Gulosibacter chungangensis]